MGYFVTKDAQGREVAFGIAGDQPTQTELARMRDILYPPQPVQQPVAPEPEGYLDLIGGGLGRGWNVGQEAYGSGIAGILKSTGNLEAAQEWQEWADKQREEAAQYPIHDLSQGFGGRFIASTGAASAPQMATTIGAALAGAKAGSFGGWPGALVGGTLGALAVNVPFFYGLNRQEQFDVQGEVTSEARAATVALGQAALESVGAYIPLKGFFARKISDGVIKAVGKGATKGAVGELITEVGQEFAQIWQAGGVTKDNYEDIINRLIEAGVGGATIGGLFGSAGATYAHRRQRKDEAVQAELEADVKKEIKDVEGYTLKIKEAKKRRQKEIGLTDLLDEQAELRKQLAEDAKLPTEQEVATQQLDVLLGKSKAEDLPLQITDQRAELARQDSFAELQARTIQEREHDLSMETRPDPNVTVEDRIIAERFIEDRGREGFTKDEMRAALSQGRMNQSFDKVDQILKEFQDSGVIRTPEQTLTGKYTTYRQAEPTQPLSPDTLSTRVIVPKGRGGWVIRDVALVPNEAGVQRHYDHSPSYKTRKDAEAALKAMRAESPDVQARLAELDQRIAEVLPEYEKQVQKDLEPWARDMAERLSQYGLSDVEGKVVNFIRGDKPDTFVEGSELTLRDAEERALRTIIKVGTDHFDPKASQEKNKNEFLGIVDHEVIHALRNMGLMSHKEFQDLVKLAQTRKRPGKKYTYMDWGFARNPDLTTERRMEEAVAEMFRHENLQKKQPAPVRSMIQKIMDFIRNIVTPFKTSRAGERVLERIRTGEMGRRERGTYQKQALDPDRDYAERAIRSIARSEALPGEPEYSRIAAADYEKPDAATSQDIEDWHERVSDLGWNFRKAQKNQTLNRNIYRTKGAGPRGKLTQGLNILEKFRTKPHARLESADFAAVDDLIDKGRELLSRVPAKRTPTESKLNELHEVASEQRGAPEIAMTRVGHATMGNIINQTVERAGDLLHRPWSLLQHGYFAQGDMKTKIDLVMNRLYDRYGFEREFEEQIVGNARNTNRFSYEELKANIYRSLDEYADAYRAIPARNDFQRKIKNLNIALGEQQWGDARALASEINDIIYSDPETYRNKVLELDKGKINVSELGPEFEGLKHELQKETVEEQFSRIPGVANGEDVWVTFNQTQIRNLYDKSVWKSLRYLIDQDGRLYVWDGSHAIHDEVVKNLKTAPRSRFEEKIDRGYIQEGSTPASGLSNQASIDDQISAVIAEAKVIKEVGGPEAEIQRERFYTAVNDAEGQWSRDVADRIELDAYEHAFRDNAVSQASPSMRWRMAADRAEKMLADPDAYGISTKIEVTPEDAALESRLREDWGIDDEQYSKIVDLNDERERRKLDKTLKEFKKERTIPEGLPKPVQDFRDEQFSRINGMINEGDIASPGFYQKSQYLVQHQGPNAVTPEGWMKFFQRNQVKPDELKWLDIKNWLNETSKSLKGKGYGKAIVSERTLRKSGKDNPEGRVPRQMVLDYIAANNMEIRERLVSSSTGANRSWLEKVESWWNNTLMEELRNEEGDLPIFHNTDINVIVQEADGEIAKLEEADSYEKANNIDPISDAAYDVYDLLDSMETYLISEERSPSDFWKDPILFEEAADMLLADIQRMKLDYRDIQDRDTLAPHRIYSGRQDLYLPSYRMNAPARSRRYTELKLSIPQSFLDPSLQYQGPHWWERNVIVHLRFDTDANGEVMRVLEVQSDWHQEGSKEGYRGDKKYRVSFIGDETDATNLIRYDKFNAFKDEVLYDEEGFFKEHTSFDSPSDFYGWADRMSKKYAKEGEYQKRLRDWIVTSHEPTMAGRFANIPDAPYKTSWPELAVKRILRYATDNGFQSISWPTGETMAWLIKGRKDLKQAKMVTDLYNHSVPNAIESLGKNFGKNKPQKKWGKTKDQIEADEVLKKYPVIFDRLNLPEWRRGLQGLKDEVLGSTRNIDGGFMPPWQNLSDGERRRVARVLDLLKSQSDRWHSLDGPWGLSASGRGRTDNPGWWTYELPTAMKTAKLLPQGLQFENFSAIQNHKLDKMKEQIRYNNVAPAMAKLGKWVPFVDEEGVQKGTEAALIKLQDRMLSVGKLIDYVRDNGGTVLHHMDTYLREMLYPGQADGRIQIATRELYSPLTQAIKDLGYTQADRRRAIGYLGQFGDRFHAGIEFLESTTYDNPNQALVDLYLYARHAQERNREIAKRHPEGSKARKARPEQADAGSGMTNTEAQQILGFFQGNNQMSKRPEEKLPELNDIKDKVRKIIDNTNDVRVKGNLTPEFRGTEYDVYDDYVPLRSWIDEHMNDGDAEPTFARAGKGFKIRGKEDFSALGRKSLGAHIIEHVILQNEEAILRSEKNKVGESFLSLLEANQDLLEGLATIHTFQPTRWGLVNGVVRRVSDPRFKGRDDVLVVKRGDREVAIEFSKTTEGQQIAKALAGETVQPSAAAELLIRTLLGFNRFMGMVRTSWNPEFMLSNFPRDFETALVNLSEYEIDGLKRTVAKNTWAAGKGIYEALRQDKAETEWAQAFDEFRKYGGMTAFMGLRNLPETINKINNELKGDFAGNTQKFRKAARSIFNTVEDYNIMVENAIRLSAFKALSDHLTQGVTDPEGIKAAKEQAAFIAKRMTTDFNMGGEWKTLGNAHSLFFNASVQGTFALANPLLRSKKVRAAWGAIVLGGFLQDMVQSAFGPEDENGQKEYDKLPDWMLETHMIMMDPTGITGRGYIKIPLQYGLNAAWNFGRNVSRMLRGKDTIGKAAGNSAGVLIDVLNPIGGTNSLLNFMAPTIVDPIVELAENKNYQGRPIRPAPNPYGTDKIASQKYWNNTGPIWTAPAEWISRGTGGGEFGYMPGKVEISPNTLEYMAEFLTGGTGMMIARIANMGFSESLPALVTGDFENVDFNEIVGARRFIGNVTTRNDTELYIKNRDKFFRIRKEIEGARSAGDTQAVVELLNKYPREFKASGVFRNIERSRRRLRRAMKTIEAREDIPEEEKQQRLEDLKERMDNLIGVANNRVAQIFSDND